MSSNMLGVAVRSFIVAAVVVCWMASIPPVAAGTLPVQSDPSAPQNLTATADGATAINPRWSAPRSDGGSAITGYEIDVSPDGTNWRFLASVAAHVTTYRHSNLTVGTTRYYQVRAHNAAGRFGLRTVAVSATTSGAAGTPGAPRNLTATAGGTSIIDLDWDAPLSNGGRVITRYEVHVSVNSGVWRLLASTAADVTAYRHANASAGTTRRYRVRAVNANGIGAPAYASVTGTGTRAPGPPRDVTADAEGSSVIELEWREPADPGSAAVTSYRIEVSADGGSSWDLLEEDLADTRYRHAGLSPGTRRHYRVAAINRHGRGDWSNVVNATTSRLPGRPARLTARSRGTSRIELDWNAPSSGVSAITGYRIEVSSTGTSRWTVLEADTRTRSTSYTHTGLDPGTRRYYRVAAINRAGRGSWSSVANATTDVAVPGAPTGLRAAPSGLGGRTQLLLTWTRPSSDGGRAVTGYRIEVSANRTGGWTALVANTRTTGTSYTHIGLAPATTRYYRVAAINAEGAGSYSNVATGRTNAGPPDAPGSLRARANGPRSIALSWQAPPEDNGARVTGYRIRARRSTQGSWITIQSNTNATVTTFLHTNLQPATAYRYQVAAINSEGAGPWSLEAGTRTHAGVPGAPTNLAARADGTSRINLSWTAPRDNGGASIIGYRIEVSADGGANWSILRGNTGSVATAFSHTGLRPGSRRDYRVSGVNAAGAGTPSRVARATTEAVLAGAPRSVMARAGGSTAIELSWDAPASDGGARITGYRIEASRSRSSGWRVIRANTQSGATTYRHTGLLAGSTWYYRVSAINGKGVGPASRVATGTTDATVPGQPRTLRAAGTSPNAIELNWDVPATDGGAAIGGYRIEASAAAGGPWVALVQNSGSTATTYTHTGLTPVTTRFYRVSAINSAGVGRPAGPVSATTLPDVPGAPTRLTATARGTSQIVLSWTAPTYDGGSAVIGYRIEASGDGGRTWSILRRNTGSRATTFPHTNLQPATTRHYRVSAINLAGAGRASNVAAATTEATVPNAPRNLRAQADGTTEIDLSWRVPTTDGGAEITGYKIDVSDDRGATWQTLVANTRSTGTTYSHSGLPPASTRHYRVSAINRIGVGRASSVASATTPPCPTRPPVSRPSRPPPPRSTWPGPRPPTTAAPRSPATGSRSRRRVPTGATWSATPDPGARPTPTRGCSRAAGGSTASRRSTARARESHRRSLRRRPTIRSSARAGSTRTSCRMRRRR